MRPLPVEPLPQMPEFVSGLALIRGRPTPVLDARRLLGSATDAKPGRYVTLAIDAQRAAALAVDEVLGVRRVKLETLDALPAVLVGQDNEHVRALGALDSDLLLLLEHTRLLSKDVWNMLEAEAART
jgi:purine-binding chemotaxis protein CheW